MKQTTSLALRRFTISVAAVATVAPFSVASLAVQAISVATYAVSGSLWIAVFARAATFLL